MRIPEDYNREQLEELDRKLDHIESYAHNAREDVLDMLEALDMKEDESLPEEEKEVASSALIEKRKSANQQLEELQGI